MNVGGVFLCGFFGVAFACHVLCFCMSLYRRKKEREEI